MADRFRMIPARLLCRSGSVGRLARSGTGFVASDERGGHDAYADAHKSDTTNRASVGATLLFSHHPDTWRIESGNATSATSREGTVHLQPPPSTDTGPPSALRLFLIVDQIGLASFEGRLGFMDADVNVGEGTNLPFVADAVNGSYPSNCRHATAAKDQVGMTKAGRERTGSFGVGRATYRHLFL
jgi:hypothetical protein